jgi:tetratricopeptide (TPR) repeat protein
MDALISGIAGRALLLEGDSLTSVDVEEASRRVLRHPSDLPFLFGEATDLRVIEDFDIDSITRELQRASNSECALDLTLITLDSELSDEIRLEAVEDLEHLLRDTLVVGYVESILYGSPLPERADINGAIDLCSNLKAPTTRSLFQRVKDHQPSIRETQLAWDAIPAEFFVGSDQRDEFQHRAVREGLFHSLALTRETQATVGSFLVSAGLNASIKTLPNYRDVLQRWAAPFRESTPVLNVTHDAEEVAEPSLSQKTRKVRRKSIDRAAVLRNVESQKKLIIRGMQTRDLIRVRSLVKELVEYQLKNGEPVFAAKSLCDLAAEAKALGMFSLQLELTEESTRVKPDDAWSWRQYADALLSTGRGTEALRAYAQADGFGGGAVAKRGRAETLKALGRLRDALDTYDAVIEDYPEDVVARSGRADTLKALGRLHDALDAYDAVVADYPEDVVARSGRADTLKALGRLREALDAYDAIIADYPENVVARNGRADTLRALGRLHDALDAYDAVVADYPENVVARNGRADTLKALGRLHDALDAYDAVIADYPENVVARNGRSCVLAALQRYDEALADLVVQTPETPQDWIGFHIRGMIMLRTGRVDEAIEIFRRGVANDPVPLSKEYFRTALAVALMRQGEFGDAVKILDTVEVQDLQPQVKLLRVHCFGENNQTPEASEAFDSISTKPWSIPDELIEELHRRYILKQPPKRSDDWVFDQESTSLLMVANQQAPISNYLY